jgi:mxaD protein
LCQIAEDARRAGVRRIPLFHTTGVTIAMKLVRGLVFAALTAACGVSFAAAPALKVSKSIEINASADAVWDKIKDFGGLNTWHPAVAKDVIVAGKDNEVGAERLLTLGDGGTIKEKLLSYDAKGHSYKYAILEGVLPVSSYSSVISVKGSGKDKSTVTWSGDFKRKDTGDKPGEKENDNAATTTMSGVYQSGLDNLKKLSEAK